MRYFATERSAAFLFNGNAALFLTKGIVAFVEISKSAHLSLAICLLFRYCVFAKCKNGGHSKYDYMKALQRQFEINPRSTQKLADEINEEHKELSSRLEKEDRKLLLWQVDMEDDLRGHATVHSFTCRYRLACGIQKELAEEPTYSFVTLALQNGVDIKTVSGMLGHFSAGFTLDTYAHVTTSAQREAANTMGNVLAGAAQSR